MFILLFILTTLFGNYAHADIINPEMYTKKCKPNEVEVTCRYKSKKPFGEHTYDECITYKEDSDYRFLVGTGSSFGGSSKYCIESELLKTKKTPKIFIKGNNYSYLLNPIIFTVLIELVVLTLLKQRNSKLYIAVIVVNILTVGFINIVINELFTVYPENVFIILMELLITVLEALIYAFMFRNIKPKFLLTYSLLANASSYLAGVALSTFLNF